MTFLGTLVHLGGDILTGNVGDFVSTAGGALKNAFTPNKLVSTGPVTGTGLNIALPVNPLTIAGVAGLPALPNQAGSVPVPGIGGAISRFLPGGQTGYEGAPKGYHINKAYYSYYIGNQQGKKLQDPTKRPEVVNLIVRNRHMNPLNARALKRATARQTAFVRLARRALRGTGFKLSRHVAVKSRGRRR